MINTVLYKKDNNICCYSVGVLDCVSIKDTKLDRENEIDTYSYEVVFSNGESCLIENVFIATDIKLV